jgi:hypothetical protein
VIIIKYLQINLESSAGVVVPCGVLNKNGSSMQRSMYRIQKYRNCNAIKIPRRTETLQFLWNFYGM